MEKDNNTFLTGSYDMTLKLWNTTTCECLDTLPMGAAVHCLLKTKDKTRFVCALDDGRVELRRVSDLGVLSTFNLHGAYAAVWNLCELEDGSFVSASGTTMKRWDEKGTVLQTFSVSSHVNRVIQLNRDVIVSASNDAKVNMWNVSTGECLRTLARHSTRVRGLEKVKDGVFASGSADGKVVVWDEKGAVIEIHKKQSDSGIAAMTRLKDGSIMTADRCLIDIRPL